MKKNIFGIIVLVLFFNSCNPNVSCGFDDGPFQGTIITVPIDDIVNNDYVPIYENCRLYYNNRDSSSCPIISYFEGDSLMFSLEMDVSKQVSSSQLFEISDIMIIRNTEKMLKISFHCFWTFGTENGYMNIDKKTGENNFCLSW